jgi:general secretion pathway protein J
MRRQRGVTLMEVLIAVSLLSLLTLGMFIAMRVGFSTYAKAQSRLMDNRRAAGAERILQQELANIIPVIAACGGSSSGQKFGFFQGDASSMRLVTTFSLQQGSRGRPQVLEMFVIPGEERGVRLVVNETPYAGPASAGRFCVGMSESIPQFLPVTAGPSSFVLADKLDYCRFSYLGPGEKPNDPGIWRPQWAAKGWPYAIRVEMAPLDPDPGRLQPTSMMAPVYLIRNMETQYGDQ